MLTLAGRVSRIVVLAAAIVAAGGSPAADNDVLYWMVDSSATVQMTDGTTVRISDFVSPTSDYAARIRVTGGDIAEDTFLNLYYPGGVVDDGEYGVDFDDGATTGYWGAGVPSGNQSPSGDYSAGTPEYRFTIEIGNIDADDNWTTVAASATVAYSALADYIHETFDVNPPSSAVWTPTSYAVPEPSGGLLTAVGLALLALRRKRRLS